MTDKEREDKIRSLALRIIRSQDWAFRRIAVYEMNELIRQRPQSYVEKMEREKGLA